MSARVRALALAIGLVSSLSAWASSPSPGATTAAASEDIRDIRGPISIPPWWRWLVASAAVLGVAAMTTAFVVHARRRRNRPLAPHERALARLAEAQALVDQGRARAYALSASDAVREYIESRFGLRAARATTEEFFAALVRDDAGQLGTHRKALTAFLEACDLAKFAQLQFPRDGLATMNELARNFVLATVPDQKTASQARTS